VTYIHYSKSCTGTGTIKGCTWQSKCINLLSLTGYFYNYPTSLQG